MLMTRCTVYDLIPVLFFGWPLYENNFQSNFLLILWVVVTDISSKWSSISTSSRIVVIESVVVAVGW